MLEHSGNFNGVFWGLNCNVSSILILNLMQAGRVANVD